MLSRHGRHSSPSKHSIKSSLPEQGQQPFKPQAYNGVLSTRAVRASIHAEDNQTTLPVLLQLRLPLLAAAEAVLGGQLRQADLLTKHSVNDINA